MRSSTPDLLRTILLGCCSIKHYISIIVIATATPGHPVSGGDLWGLRSSFRMSEHAQNKSSHDPLLSSLPPSHAQPGVPELPRIPTVASPRRGLARVERGVKERAESGGEDLLPAGHTRTSGLVLGGEGSCWSSKLTRLLHRSASSSVFLSGRRSCFLHQEF